MKGLKYRVTADELAELPEAIAELYSSEGELQVDLDGSPIKSALSEEREKSKRYLSRLKAAGIDPEYETKTDRERELEAQLAELQAERDEAAGERTAERIKSAVTEAARAAGVLDTALSDITELAASRFALDSDGRPVTRGADGYPDDLSPAEWIKAQQSERRHWWPPSTGGGSSGSGFDIRTEMASRGDRAMTLAQLQRKATRNG